MYRVKKCYNCDGYGQPERCEVYETGKEFFAEDMFDYEPVCPYKTAVLNDIAKIKNGEVKILTFPDLVQILNEE